MSHLSRAISNYFFALPVRQFLIGHKAIDRSLVLAVIIIYLVWPPTKPFLAFSDVLGKGF